ncbi:MAG: lipoate protein ligase C-terminal domain-containing protein [Candidatus Thorarchaeota archaeon]
MRQSIYKVPNGKLIKVKLSIKGDSIETIILTGDFFLHPEVVLDEIEKGLIGVNLDETSIRSSIDQILRNNGAVLIGASSTDFAHAILLAI